MDLVGSISTLNVGKILHHAAAVNFKRNRNSDNVSAEFISRQQQHTDILNYLGHWFCFGKHWCKASLFSFSHFLVLLLLATRLNLWLGYHRWHFWMPTLALAHMKSMWFSISVKHTDCSMTQHKPYENDSLHAIISHTYIHHRLTSTNKWLHNVCKNAITLCARMCYFNYVT